MSSKKENKNKVISVRITSEMYDIIEAIAYQTKDAYLEAKNPVNAYVSDLLIQKVFPVYLRLSIEQKIPLDTSKKEFIQQCILSKDMSDITLLSQIDYSIQQLIKYKENLLETQEKIDEAIYQYETVYNEIPIRFQSNIKDQEDAEN